MPREEISRVVPICGCVLACRVFSFHIRGTGCKRVLAFMNVLAIDKGPGDRSRNSREMVDMFLTAMADAIADRLEHRQDARRRLLDVERTAEYLDTSKSSVHNLVSDKKLKPVRFDRRIHFDIRDLDKLIDEAKGQA